jgi:hypothetical protein
MMRSLEIVAGHAVNGFGGKANGLSSLLAVGANIPPTLCISANPEDLGQRELFRSIEALVKEWSLSLGAPTEWIARSSHSQEDSFAASFAGLFPSRVIPTDEGQITSQVIDTIIDILKVLLTTSEDSAVLLQPYIEGVISGVFFSSDPNEGESGKGIVTYVAGPCSSLVDGSLTPVSVRFSENSILGILPPPLSECWSNLYQWCIGVEAYIRAPVDCEFTMNGKGELFLLQARPVAALTSWKHPSELLPIRLGQRLPASVVSHPKVRLRLECEKEAVAISPAWIATESKWFHVPKFNLPAGSYTSVLLHPRLLHGKVKRRFSTDGYSGALAVLRDATDYWVRHAIVASLIPSQLTGIGTVFGKKIIVEVARGHFIPKGLVDTTVYELEGDAYSLLQQPPQHFYYDVNPESGEAERKDSESYTSLTGEQLRSIETVIHKLRSNDGDCLEFGVDLEGRVFVIDVQRNHSGIESLPSNNQVISLGEAEGILMIVNTASGAGAEDHFFEFVSSISTNTESKEQVIVAFVRPELGLLREFQQLSKLGKQIVGAICEVYSPLSHLSLLLREWGIPTIVIPGFRDSPLAKASKVRITASNEGGTITNVG